MNSISSRVSSIELDLSKVPRWLLYLVIPALIVLPSKGMANWCSYLLLVSVLSSGLHRQHFLSLWRENASFKILLLFMALLIASTLWSSQANKILSVLFDALLVISLLTAASFSAHKNLLFLRNLKRLIVICTTSIAINALISAPDLSVYLQIWANTSASENFHQARLSGYGLHHNANLLAFNLGLGLGLAYSLYITTHQRTEKLLYCFAAATLCVALILTGSKAPLLAVFIFVIFVHMAKHSSSIPILMLIPVAMLGPLIGLLSSNGYEFNLEHIPRGISFRDEIWATAINLLSENLVWGAGYGPSPDVAVVHTPPIIHLHSHFLSLLASNGLAGYYLWLACLFALLRNTREQHNAVPWLFYGIIIYSLDGNLLLDKVDHVWLLIWLPFALILNVARGRSFNQASNN